MKGVLHAPVNRGRAIEVLKHHPQFPATQVQILESTKEAMAA